MSNPEEVIERWTRSIHLRLTICPAKLRCHFQVLPQKPLT